MCPPKRVPSAVHFFSLCTPAMLPPPELQPRRTTQLRGNLQVPLNSPQQRALVWQNSTFALLNAISVSFHTRHYSSDYNVTLVQRSSIMLGHVNYSEFYYGIDGFHLLNVFMSPVRYALLIRLTNHLRYSLLMFLLTHYLGYKCRCRISKDRLNLHLPNHPSQRSPGVLLTHSAPDVLLETTFISATVGSSGMAKSPPKTVP
ncbi:UNVERIFIED_CONTAM: hypothetical protein FKN15_069432 [Acipenser sinensis]